MGTLYECLKEARLEKYFGTFRAHGITNSEALIHITPHDFITFGMTSLDDRHRLLELISIVKSVHSFEGYSVASGRNSEARGGLPRKRNRSPAVAVASKNQGLSPVGDVRVRDNRSTVSNHPSAGQESFLSVSSSSEESETDLSEHSDYEPATKHLNAASLSPQNSRIFSAEKIKVKHTKGYNYGVPTGGTKNSVNMSKTKSNKSHASHHSREERIKVCVRKRPMNRREKKSGEEDIVIAESTTVLKVNEPKLAVDLRAYTLQHEFMFDEVFDENCSNEDVYIRAARPLINCVFDGGSATCFAYGQTGAGKTHTMIGNQEVPGLYLLAAHDIFSIIETQRYGAEIKVWVSFFEIYCGQLFDLLNKRNRLYAREDGSQKVCITGLTETEASGVQTLMQVLEYGNAVRSKGATGFNPDSSRSHAILQLEVRNNQDKRLGKMSFIDLAGSERAADVTDTDRQTRMEGAEINQSLLALKECIRSIDQERRHTPFRQSKLTHILKDSFLGNSLTCMIANISPMLSTCEHSLNTLRYADRVKELRKEGSTSGTRSSLPSPFLMNIPAAPASVFHPSNVLCSSTPVRPSSSRQFTHRNMDHFNLDPSETPIKGSFMRKKPSSAQKKSPKQFSKPSLVKAAGTKVSVVRHVAPLQSAVQHTAGAGISSKSKHTDIDSYYVPGPEMTPNNPDSAPPTNILVTGSTDTENDFPTTDFNNENELNDLNRTGGKSKQLMTAIFQTQKITASVPVFNTSVLKMKDEIGYIRYGPVDIGEVSMSTPLLRPKSYKTDSPRQLPQSDIVPQRLAEHSTSKNSNTKSEPVITPIASQPKLSDTSPQHHVSFFKPDAVGTESFEDDLLFVTPEEQQCNQSNVRNALSTPKVAFDYERLPITPRSAQNLGLTSTIPAVLPAKSSDLTTFSVRSPQRFGQKQSPESSPSFCLSEKKVTDGILPLSYVASLQQENQAKLQPIFDAMSKLRNHEELENQANIGTSRHTQNIIRYESTWQGVSYAKQYGLPAQNQLEKSEINTDGDISRGDNHNFNNNAVVSVKSITASSDSSLPSDQWYMTPADHDTHVASSTSKLHKTLSRLRQTSSDSQLSALSDEQVQKTVLDPDADEHETLAKEIDMEFPEFLAMPTESVKIDVQKSIVAASARSRLNALLKELTASTLDDSFKSDSVKSSKSQDVRSNHSDSNLLSSTLARDLDTLCNPCHEMEVKLNTNSDSSMKKNSACSLGEYNGMTHINVGRLPSTDSINSGEEQKVTESSRDSKTDSTVSHLTTSPQKQEYNIERIGGESIGFNSGVKNNGSPVVVSVINKDSPFNDRTVKSNSPFSGKSTNSAIKTEKLQGGVFSPIHPQPVTKNRPSKSSTCAVSKVIVEPRAVSSNTTSTNSNPRHTPKGLTSPCDQLDGSNMSQLIASHEDQLASVTSLCKQEMKLLLGAKAGNKTFDEYIQKVSNILQQKMSAIQLLQTEIHSLTISQDNNVSSSS